MLTIENKNKIIDKLISKDRVVEYYVFHIKEFPNAYQIHLRCPHQRKSDELIVLLKTSDVIGPVGELTYAMYDNSNPLNRMYLRVRDISDISRFVSSVEFLVNKYILC